MTDKVFKLDEDDFDEFISKHHRVIVDFWATWCSPCLAMNPVIESLAAEYGSRVRFVKVNVEENANIASRYGIQAIPAFVFFDHGKVVHQVKGMHNAKNFKEEVDRVYEF